MMAAIADDWNAELQGAPSWAIQNACRWWMSADNDKRRQKPMPGDISARCKIELGVVKIAELALRRFEGGGYSQQPAEQPCDPATAAEIVALAGYAAKRMGGAA